MALPTQHQTAATALPAPSAWPRLRRLLNLAFIALALGLLGLQLRGMDAQQLHASLSAVSFEALAAAAAFSALSYAAYCGFDLLGRRYTRHRLRWREVFTLGFVSHAFALNFGAAGVAFRFRAYGRRGVHAGVVARLWLVCMVSNWLGFLVIAGVLLAAQPGGPPFAGLGLEPGWLRLIGLGFLAAALVYFCLCRWSKLRSWTAFRQTLELPSLRFALAQCALSVLQWGLIAAGLFALFRGAVPFLTVLAVLLVCASALAVVDVPGGLGVTEAVFIALLGGQVAMAALVSALLVYRLVYFLGPLLLAGLAYLRLEMVPPRLTSSGSAGSAR